MIDYKYKSLFLENSIDKQLTLTFENLDKVTNSDIYYESMEISESLCSDPELRFGCCESSCLRITIANVNVSHIGQTVKVSMVLNGLDDEPFIFGKYKVISDKPTADRTKREIVAYDSLYDVLNANVAEWYNGLSFPITLKNFRDSFFAHFGIEQDHIDLINDGISLSKTIDGTEISGKDIITSICEINGCFGHITRQGLFRYVVLDVLAQGIYPSNTLYPNNSLFPSEEVGTTQISKSYYEACEYEDYEVKNITKVQIKGSEDTIDGSYGTNEENVYTISGNFLCYDRQDLDSIAQKLFSQISKVSYRPASVSCVGNPCLEVGDGIRLATKNKIVYTYILQRTISGIQALKDGYIANGEETQTGNINSVSNALIRMNGKTNELIRTLDETRSTLTDADRGLQTQITQTAESVTIEANRAIGEENELRSAISINAESITSEVARAGQAESALSTRITQTATSITSEVTRASQAENALSTRITQNADSITSEASRASEAEGNLSTRITQNADSITSISEQTIGNGETSLKSLINQNASSISAEVSRAVQEDNILSGRININAYDITSEVTRAQGAEAELSSRISITEDGITAEVTRAQGIESGLSAAIQINANSISSKVSANGVVSAINQTPESITISANKIDLDGVVNASQLTTKFATITSLNATNAEVNNLKTASITADRITTGSVNGTSVAWRNIRVMGDASLNVGKETIYYKGSDGTTKTIEVVTSVMLLRAQYRVMLLGADLGQ